MTAAIDNVISKVSNFLYTPWVPLFLVVAGVVLTVCTRFVQLRMVRESIRVVREKPQTEGAGSSFGALMISTASRVGTGNIVGVAQAICLGGEGAAPYGGGPGTGVPGVGGDILIGGVGGGTGVPAQQAAQGGDEGDEGGLAHAGTDAVEAPRPQVLAGVGSNGVAEGHRRGLQQAVELVGGGKARDVEIAQAVEHLLHRHAAHGDHGILEGHGRGQL